MDTHNKLAILCGGGPAPGLNSVIAAATIRARLEGIDVIGLRDGFEWVMQGDIDHITPLSSFNFETPDDPEFKAAWALSNLRPMWGPDNISKSAKRTHLL